jgi:hypothetical protein
MARNFYDEFHDIAVNSWAKPIGQLRLIEPGAIPRMWNEGWDDNTFPVRKGLG